MARPAAHEIARVPPRHAHEQQAEVPEALELTVGHAEDNEVVRVAVGEREAEQAHRRRVAAVEPAGDPLRVEEDVLADEDEPERGEPEVDPAQPPGDGAEQRAGEPGREDRPDGRQDGRQAGAARRARQPRRGRLAREVAVAVGPDGDVERVGERQLAGHAHQQREPDRADRRRHREQPGLQPEALGVERQPQKKAPQRDDRDPAGEPAAVRHG
jgi:hypothetical protein